MNVQDITDMCTKTRDTELSIWPTHISHLGGLAPEFFKTCQPSLIDFEVQRNKNDPLPKMLCFLNIHKRKVFS